MTGAQLSVAIFFWGSAVAIGLDAAKADGLRRIVLSSLTVLFIVAGFAVKPLWLVFPDVSAALTTIATHPVAWFVLAAVAYLGLRQPSHRAAEKPPTEAPPTGDAERAPVPQAGFSAHQRERLSAAMAEIEDFMREASKTLGSQEIYNWPATFQSNPKGFDQFILRYADNFTVIGRGLRHLEEQHGTELAMADLPVSLAELQKDLQEIGGPLSPVLSIVNRLQPGQDDAVFVKGPMEHYRINLNGWLTRAHAIQAAARGKRLELEGFHS